MCCDVRKFTRSRGTAVTSRFFMQNPKLSEQIDVILHQKVSKCGRLFRVSQGGYVSNCGFLSLYTLQFCNGFLHPKLRKKYTASYKILEDYNLKIVTTSYYLVIVVAIIRF
jgi:hypothetical protein